MESSKDLLRERGFMSMRPHIRRHHSHEKSFHAPRLSCPIVGHPKGMMPRSQRRFSVKGVKKSKKILDKGIKDTKKGS